MKRDINLPNSLMDLVALLSANQVVTLTKAYLALTAWIIWNCRNDRLFHYVMLSPPQLMRRIYGFIFTPDDGAIDYIVPFI